MRVWSEQLAQEFSTWVLPTSRGALEIGQGLIVPETGPG